MDKNAIKKYAVWARRELISRVSQKALQYGISGKENVPASAATVNGVVLSAEEIKQRKALIDQINAKGYEQVMEEVAYTWFNRFIALRFMEVNGYLPSHVRVFTDEDNAFKPQIITEAINLELDGLDMDKVYAWKDANDNDSLFKYLIITQCNALSPILPRMFQRIADYTELLFPDNLLREGSAIQQMIELIPEDDWKDAVQIIGWLYQFYNIEPKAEVFAKNGKISKEEIPAATQLFTPDWIVRYMVENSLGRLWLEHLAASGEEYHYCYDENGNNIASSVVTPASVQKLKSNWKYYLDEAEQEPDVQAQLAAIRKEYASMSPEQIKCIDPCAGSGHILVYMFDVLVQIYEDYGYSAREAVRGIVENNLYGLDIDERAAQLAYFAVMMKARQYDRRFFTRKDENGNPDVPQPHVYAIVESNGVDRYALDYFINGDVTLKKAMDSIFKEMRDAKEYGSIINITPVDFETLYARFAEVRDDISICRETVLNDIFPLVQVAQVMAQTYDVAITNPPYMGNMPPAMADFALKNYSAYKYDSYALFVAKMKKMLTPSGVMALVTGDSWLTLSSFDEMREDLLRKMTISNLASFGSNAFEAGFGTVAFVMEKKIPGYRGCYIDLTEDVNKAEILQSSEERKQKMYFHDADVFCYTPDKEILYNASDKELRLFAKEKLSTALVPKAGIVAGNNDLYLRLWHEVSLGRITFDAKCGSDVSNIHWVPLHKGGGYRKHYGIHEYVIRLQQMLTDRSINKSIRTGDSTFYFREGITWSTLSNKFGVRNSPEGFVYNTKGSMCFAKKPECLKYIIGYLNSTVAVRLMKVIAPNLDFNSGTVVKIPYIYQPNESIDYLVDENIELAKRDWDSYETSWEYKEHPMIRLSKELWDATAIGASMHYYYGCHPKVSGPLELCYMLWQGECQERFKQLKENEEELNRIFIDIYGLQDELTPDVEDKDVTVRLADKKRDIKSLISYAVGCMFGRYSLDVPGLAYAGGEWDDSKYTTFKADKDSIIPICDDEYFADDIVGRFIRFVEVVYGKDTLQENLRFIADALGGSGQPKEVIRNYFLNDFYADHLKVYQKLPIYWLFDSGKKNGFKALVYMHRYAPDTIARMRTDYVHEQQARYRTAIADLEQRIASASTAERVKLSKRLKTIQEQAAEIQSYEEKIHHLADQYIAIDLDDGVKKNYAIFGDVLAKIK